MKTYEVSFYAQIPGEGDLPLETMEVKAEGALDAQEIAGGRAAVKGIKHPYVVARPKHASTRKESQ